MFLEILLLLSTYHFNVRLVKWSQTFLSKNVLPMFSYREIFFNLRFEISLALLLPKSTISVQLREILL